MLKHGFALTSSKMSSECARRQLLLFCYGHNLCSEFWKLEEHSMKDKAMWPGSFSRWSLLKLLVAFSIACMIGLCFSNNILSGSLPLRVRYTQHSPVLLLK